MKQLRSIIIDAVMFAGLGLLVYGLWMVYHPLAYIVGGLGLIGMSIIANLTAK